MTYVREQTSAELAAHIRSLQKMAGWFDPLSDRLWQEVEALQAELAGLKTGYEAYEQVNAELKAEVDRLNDEYDKAWRHDLNDKKNVQALAAEVTRLSAENEALRQVMSAVVAEIPGAHISRSGNAPGHCHSIPGVWDRDNGAKAGKECAWCKVWNYAAAMGKGEQS